MGTYARTPRRIERSRTKRDLGGSRPAARPQGVAPPAPVASATAAAAPSLPAPFDREEASRIVAREVRRYRTWRLDAADLHQAGMLGVEEAASRFRPASGPFASYASFWVRKEMQRALAGGEFAAGLPADYPSRAVALRRVLAEVGGDVVAAGERLGLPTEAVGSLMAIVESRSLDDLLHGEVESAAWALGTDSVEEVVIASVERSAVRRAVSSLPEFQRAAVVLRFGLDGGGERSHREVARCLGLSDFTVRQLVARAVLALRGELEALGPAAQPIV